MFLDHCPSLVSIFFEWPLPLTHPAAGAATHSSIAAAMVFWLALFWRRISTLLITNNHWKARFNNPLRCSSILAIVPRHYHLGSLKLLPPGALDSTDSLNFVLQSQQLRSPCFALNLWVKNGPPLDIKKGLLVFASQGWTPFAFQLEHVNVPTGTQRLECTYRTWETFALLVPILLEASKRKLKQLQSNLDYTDPSLGKEID